MNNNLKDLASVVTTVLEGKFATKLVDQAIEIALDMADNMTGAVKKIEKLKNGLSKDKDVAAALKAANESVKVTEAKKPGKGKITLDIDFVSSDVGSNKKEVTDAEKKFKIKIKRKTSSTADVTGEKKNILAFLRSPSHDMDQDDIEDIFPEIFEAVDNGPMDGRTKAGKKFIERINKRRGTLNAAGLSEKELSAKQKKYQEFFAKALEKFGVKSPAELEGDKKKEFFDYIDKNYEGDNESD